jgi:hypothetical protein
LAVKAQESAMIADRCDSTLSARLPAAPEKSAQRGRQCISSAANRRAYQLPPYPDNIIK